MFIHVNRPTPRPCPSCGHCPTCGRGGYQAYPAYPYLPWWRQPYTWTTGSDITYSNGTDVTNGTQ